ncbi:hypothetical protein FDG2_4023 [Candidatus Protofrankia californiensis]|uniref:Uncharacterized protein n=1 Tax=Candidatus Protofrankia californiensis TaxID=1839754 RepID=A0A1C3P2S7_9ACTN|nr:hypothetical protein FDG2_4023 [Candidatus Protofrankia californiensis]
MACLFAKFERNRQMSRHRPPVTSPVPLRRPRRRGVFQVSDRPLGPGSRHARRIRPTCDDPDRDKQNLDLAPVAQLLAEWRHTAEVYADPELHAILTRPHDGDHRPGSVRMTDR